MAQIFWSRNDASSKDSRRWLGSMVGTFSLLLSNWLNIQYTRASCIYSVKGETVEYQKKELILTFAPLSLLSPLSVSSSSVCFPFFVVHTSPHIDCEWANTQLPFSYLSLLRRYRRSHAIQSFHCSESRSSDFNLSWISSSMEQRHQQRKRRTQSWWY